MADIDSGSEALHRVLTHEQVCAERYRAIEGYMSRAEKRHDEMKSDIKGLYSRFWAVALSLISLLIGIIIIYWRSTL